MRACETLEAHLASARSELQQAFIRHAESECVRQKLEDEMARKLQEADELLDSSGTQQKRLVDAESQMATTLALLQTSQQTIAKAEEDQRGLEARLAEAVKGQARAQLAAEAEAERRLQAEEKCHDLKLQLAQAAQAETRAKLRAEVESQRCLKTVQERQFLESQLAEAAQAEANAEVRAEEVSERAASACATGLVECQILQNELCHLEREAVMTVGRAAGTHRAKEEVVTAQAKCASQISGRPGDDICGTASSPLPSSHQSNPFLTPPPSHRVEGGTPSPSGSVLLRPFQLPFASTDSGRVLPLRHEPISTSPSRAQLCDITTQSVDSDEDEDEALGAAVSLAVDESCTLAHAS